MRKKETELAELDIRVKVVAFDANFMALAYIQETNLPWPLLLDSEHELYTKYGMTRGSWWSLYGPASIWKYLKLIWGGQKPGRPGKDWRQLGGDVLIDPQGIVRMHHSSTDPHDRPSVSSILKTASDRR